MRRLQYRIPQHQKRVKFTWSKERAFGHLTESHELKITQSGSLHQKSHMAKIT
jgi:hypothetical protein